MAAAAAAAAPAGPSRGGAAAAAEAVPSPGPGRWLPFIDVWTEAKGRIRWYKDDWQEGFRHSYRCALHVTSQGPALFGCGDVGPSASGCGHRLLACLQSASLGGLCRLTTGRSLEVQYSKLRSGLPLCRAAFCRAVPTCRILAPSVYIFLASLLPALAFGLQMTFETRGWRTAQRAAWCADTTHLPHTQRLPGVPVAVTKLITAPLGVMWCAWPCWHPSVTSS